jgi:mannose-6-phosphate isomerase-like protein (cupin superfamily)
LAGVQIKSLENRDTFAEASVTLVGVAPGGVIEFHVHPREHETIFVLTGRALLLLPNEEVLLEATDGGTIPPGTRHGLKNVGEEPVQLLAIHIPPIM